MLCDESVEIDAPAEEIFRISQDYEHRLDWDPFLQSAELIGAEGPGVGVRALCVSRGGWAMETQYVSFNPPRAVAVTMTRGPWFLKTFAGSWRFEDADAGRTRVGFRYSLTTRPAWLSGLLTPMIARAFALDTRRRLEALRAFAEASAAK
jgi:ribosome-associated toxin RatA of RatAB toxin-antitoxin module